MSDGTSPRTHRPPAEKRRIGRPRPPATDQSILRATIELLTEGGTTAATVDAIVRRSGCAKTTIYRRWPSRHALILQAFRVAVQATDEEIRGAEHFEAASGSTVRSSARNVLYRALVGEPIDEDVADGIAELIMKGASGTEPGV